MHKLAIIDTIGPFIEDVSGETINWSKVNFAALETNGRLTASTRKKLAIRFDAYLRHIRTIGYNAISIDDLAHMAWPPFYNPSLSTLLADYSRLYTEIFSLAKRHGLAIYVTTDYLFSHPEIDKYCKNKRLSTQDFFVEILELVFEQFPQIDGVILRIGENDGKDVAGTFLSSLHLKTPEDANALLKRILPSFERREKTLIFRTWTVGVYAIGDLIWNPKTFDAVFASIQSKSLIISMKYGDTDFMRELTLNPLFFRSDHQKIIELQTRREWEGMGVYPSFVGWDYDTYRAQLAQARGVVGIHVWCQTGGWAKPAWSNITYGTKSSFWNELNTEITVHLFKSGLSLDNALRMFCTARNIQDKDAFANLLKFSDTAIKKGLYIPEISRQPLYFRRSRIPTLLWLTWDKTLLNPLTISVLKTLIRQPERAIKDSRDAVIAIEAMHRTAKQLHLPPDVLHSIEFQLHTFRLFGRIREAILQDTSPNIIQQLNRDILRYQKTYPEHYTVFPLNDKRYRTLPYWLLSIALRRSSRYRVWDRLLLATSPLQRWLVRHLLRRSGSHLADQSMGIDVLFM